MRGNQYKQEKYMEKLMRGECSGFVSGNMASMVRMQLGKREFSTFCPFEGADKVIFYTKAKPKVSLCKILCKGEITHAMVLGTLFGLSLCDDVFGDIVYYQGHFYVYIFSEIYDYLKQELVQIGKYSARIEEVPLDSLADYQREFLTKKVIVSSLRVDNVISRVIGDSREGILERIREQEVILNDEVLKKRNVILKEGDRFSVRKYGKFSFEEIEGKTKKEHFILKIQKYC